MVRLCFVLMYSSYRVSASDRASNVESCGEGSSHGDGV